MKKNILVTFLVALFGFSMTAVSANADANHPGTMGYEASKEQSEEPETGSLQQTLMTQLNITSGHPIYDISQFQGYISNKKAAALKNEVPFVILRVQYGSSYADTQFQHNAQMMQQYGIPYGVYSYSMYTSAADAKNEATTLVNRAPNAAFYVNDFEESTSNLDKSAGANVAWEQQVATMAPGKKIFLYSGSYFLGHNTSLATRSVYSGIWEANYGGKTRFSPVLHQYTDKHKSGALNERVDASTSKFDPSWFGQNIPNKFFSASRAKKHHKRKYKKIVRKHKKIRRSHKHRHHRKSFKVRF